MSIDPRIMRTLLQLQWMPGLNLDGSSQNMLSTGTDNGSSLFGDMLQQLLSESSGLLQPGGETEAMTDTASAAQLFKQPLPYFPSIQNTGEVPAGDSSSYDSYINEAASKFGIDPTLIRAVIHTESSFNPNSVSSAGAKGLMQLMDATARGLGVTNSFDPKQNIEGGARFLSYLMRKYEGNEQAALAAYNAGPGRVDRAGIRTDADVAEKLESLPSETRRYIEKVLNAKAMYAV
ncbi:lytic transglycosylase domain-containing protein [Paenibacillus sp. sptzw28]|uniref:lytic transglycosylase domain-containing protein n=1 Tax=Paenibacillus sp. sptzw28 TaxID=715179 RepID=UPI001C6E8E7D|nr:lytic transglycosylase domain-containing protein [Paenibacillus sp. sptzw28]QYR20117.1 lytic transglycosylase domain-containing protein [Paenibacillus sp. sptzw28]